MLVQKIKNHISKNTLFLYSYNEKTKYQDYITVLSSHFKAVYELRDNETVIRENIFKYDEKYKNEQKLLKEKFPIIIDEKLN